MSVLAEPRRAETLPFEAVFRLQAAAQRERELAALPDPSLDDVASKRNWQPEDYQKPPPGIPGIDWSVWILLGGRGVGKTDTMSHYVNQHAMGPPCDTSVPGGHRIGIVSPTIGDAVGACVKGPTGLRAHNPEIKLHLNSVGGASITWPNGAEGRLFSAFNEETVQRLRSGGNRCLDYWDEFAAWPKIKEAYDQATLGLRIGQHPHAVVSTTPRPKPKLIELIKDERTRVVGPINTDRNPHLSAQRRAEYQRLYAGTRLGRQELGGEIIADIEGALWSRDTIERNRVRKVPGLRKVVVGVDPSGSISEGASEQGIVVCGIGDTPFGWEPPPGVDVLSDSYRLTHGYVLADYSCSLSPDGWSRRAVQAYVDYQADAVVVEVNFGGDMAASVILTTAQHMRVHVNVLKVTASRGKAVRADPIAAMDAQGRIHHLGTLSAHLNGTNGAVHDEDEVDDPRDLSKLEDQMATWVPGEGKSPDRVDARVWAFTHLLVEGAPVGVWAI